MNYKDMWLHDENSKKYKKPKKYAGLYHIKSNKGLEDMISEATEKHISYGELQQMETNELIKRMEKMNARNKML